MLRQCYNRPPFHKKQLLDLAPKMRSQARVTSSTVPRDVHCVSLQFVITLSIISPFVPPTFSVLHCIVLQAPFPTNSPWQNLVLGDGTVPELVSPYLVSCRNGGIAFGFPAQTVSSTSIIQVGRKAHLWQKR